MTARGRLVPVVPRQLGETPMSWLCRLAHVHIGQPVKVFCRAVGLSRGDIWRGDDVALHSLAALGSEDAEMLSADSLKRLGKGCYLFRGNSLCGRVILQDHVQYCPDCLEEDRRQSRFPPEATWAHRSLWQLRCFDVCPDHLTPLVNVPLLGRPTAAADFQSLVAPKLRALVGHSSRETSVQPGALQAYVHNRLNGGCGPAFLDLHDLRDAINVTEMVGAASVRGVHIGYDISSLGGRTERDAGFAIMAGGEEKLKGFLIGLAQNAHSGRTRFAPRATFGSLHTFFAEGPGRDAGPARDVFREVLFATFPYDEGTNVGGAPAPAPQGITLRQAAKTWNLHPKRFRRVLSAEGIISTDTVQTPNFILLDAEGAELVAQDLNDSLRLIDLPEHLGCSRNVAESLVNYQLVGCVGEGRMGLRRTGFRRRDIDRFMQGLLNRAVPVESEADDWLPLVSAVRRLRVSSGKVISEPIAGNLADLRRITNAGLRIDALRFHLPSATAAFRQTTDREELPASVAAATLHMSVEAVLALSNPEWGESGLQVRRRIKWQGGERPVFLRDDLYAFRSRYALLVEEARKRRLFPGEARRRLDANGVYPAFPPDRVHVRVYERHPIFFDALR